ncbi:hypothetical protein [Aquimarina sp. 2304DJ70-9]|uniref:hypothetical protein n=1 Tax=Aquimarina penaris TaxID=3231044 RepID=UPI00346264D2
MKNEISRYELLGATADYMGQDPLNDYMMKSEIVSELTSNNESIQSMPKSDEKFSASKTFATLKSNDYKPGQSFRIRQTGFDICIFNYTFDSTPGGHASGHRSDFRNGLPTEVRLLSGESKIIRFGGSTGFFTEQITGYLNGVPATGGGFGNIIETELVRLNSSHSYVLIGSNVKHPSNHWGTPKTISTLQSIANEYFNQTGHKLYFNDMSLKWGGVFDIKGGYSPSHFEHRNGRQVDIAATKSTMSHEAEFLKILRKYTTNYILEGTGSRRHYHVRF